MEIKGKVIKTTTEDGLELDAVFVEPKTHAQTAIVHFHGKEGDFLQNHFVAVMAEEYPKNGYAFMTASHRGKSYMADILRKSATGYQYTQLGSAFDIFEDCVFDIEAWVRELENRGYKNIILQQHSTPQKILWYAFKRSPSSVSALILISPADIAYLFERYVPEYEKNLSLAKKLVRQGKGKDLMPVPLWSNCPVSAATFVNWGDQQSNIQVFNFLHPKRGFRYFPRVRLPMIAILAENDFSVGNKAEQCLTMLERNTKSKKFKTAIIKNSEHSFLHHEKELTGVILAFIRELNL